MPLWASGFMSDEKFATLPSDAFKGLEDHLAALEQLVFASTLPGSKPGDYAEYLDEADPDAGVQICRKDGTTVVMMPTSVWEEFTRKAGT